MSFQGAWSSVLRTLTIPQDAGPGEARIVISGSQLPPPLDTFLVTTLAGDAPYSAGIVFYGEGDDTTYQYIAVVPEPGVSDRFATHWGCVLNGAVLEENNGLVGGYPQAFKMRLAAGPDFFTEVTTENLSVLVDQILTLFTRNGNISLSAINGAVTVQANQFSCEGFQISGSNAFFTQKGVTATNKLTNTFSNYPDNPAVTLYKTMHSGLTAVRVRFEPGFWVSAAGTGAEFAVLNGGTDYVTRWVNAALTPNAHMIAPGVVQIGGLNEGNHTFTGRWRNVTAVGNLTADGNDMVTLEAWEVSI